MKVYFIITIAIFVIILIYNIITNRRLKYEKERVSRYYSNLRTKLSTAESFNSNYEKCLQIIIEVQRRGYYSYLNGKMIKNFQIKGNGKFTSSRRLSIDGKNITRLSDNGIVYISVGHRFYPLILWNKSINSMHINSPDSSNVLKDIIATKFVEVDKNINQKFIQEVGQLE